MEILRIESLAECRAGELSGGELRRTAIARVLCSGAKLILADEPTGDLDSENTATVLEAAEGGAAVFLVTHEAEAMSIADYRYGMTDGKLSAE